MASAAEVIILSSSPNPPRSPGLATSTHNANRIARDSPRGPTPPPIPLTSRSQTRSRFFPTPIASAKVPKDATRLKKRTSKKDSEPNTSGQIAASNPRRKAKKSAEAPEPTDIEDPQHEPSVKRIGAVKPTKSRTRKNVKTQGLGNMTLAGKVTKTSGDPPAKKPSNGGQKTVSTEFSPLEDVPDNETARDPNALGKDEVLHLDEAMRRRMDWTPPRDTTCEDLTIVHQSNNQIEDGDTNAVGGFGKLLSDYNYSGSTLNPRNSVQSANGGPTKRRRIELVKPEIQTMLTGRQSDSSDQTPAQDEKDTSGKFKKKPTAKPKKLTTLTARMTAQYAMNDTEEDAPVLDCVTDTKTARNRRKAKVTDKASPFTVLTPEAALEFLNEQDLVFGTCSQLEREDSPQTLRDIQQAIRASEGGLQPEEMRNEVSKSLQEHSIPSVSRVAGTRNLWGVSARDTEGSLIQAEPSNVVDLTNGMETSTGNSLEDDEQAIRKTLPENWFELEFAGLDSPSEKRPSSSSLAKNDSVPAAAPVPLPTKARARATATKSGKGAGENSSGAVGFRPPEKQAPVMPQYTGFTDAELSRQISTFGFKAVRGRKKMIELLQQCWESNHGRNATSDSQPMNHPEAALPKESVSNGLREEPLPKTKTEVTTKPKASTKSSKSLGTTKATLTSQKNHPMSPNKSSRGKPTTKTSTSFIDVEEIQDSEEEIIPSPSQVQKHYTDLYSKPKAGSQVQSKSLDILTKSPSLSPTKRKVLPKPSAKAASAASITTTCTSAYQQLSLAEIGAQITQAVRVQSRLEPLSSFRGSRKKPTWHEKILMYDPIVLEDFAGWLNVEGLGLVGEDREVGPGLVREWCESKGICSCWKNNWSW